MRSLVDLIVTGLCAVILGLFLFAATTSLLQHPDVWHARARQIVTVMAAWLTEVVRIDAPDGPDAETEPLLQHAGPAADTPVAASGGAPGTAAATAITAPIEEPSTSRRDPMTTLLIAGAGLALVVMLFGPSVQRGDSRARAAPAGSEREAAGYEEPEADPEPEIEFGEPGEDREDHGAPSDEGGGT